MTIVAICGSPCTTTALGLTAAWPAGERAVAVEADPAGGCAAAWLGVPVEPGLATLAAQGTSARWHSITEATQHTPSGLPVICAPSRAAAAGAASAAAAATVLPMMAASTDTTFVVDAGALGAAVPPAVRVADVVVIVHRQHAASAPAAAVGLERVADGASVLTPRAVPLVLLLLGERPYALDEVADFVGIPAAYSLPADPFAAAVLAGRASRAGRLHRTPLWRALGRIAGDVAAMLRSERDLVAAVADQEEVADV